MTSISIKRLGRISEEIKRIVSNAIMTELRSRISPMTSVTEVEVTRFKICKDLYKRHRR